MPSGLTGNWGGVERGLTSMASSIRWQRAFDQAAQKEAWRLHRILVQSFNKGGPPGEKWAPLAAFTQIVRKVEGKPGKVLQKDGDLRNSINVVHEGGVWFVGVHRSAKNRKGDSLVNIALVHEKGTRRFTIQVTDRMRRYFFWLFKATNGQIQPLSKSTTHLSIRIPARPLFGPVWEQEEDNAADNIRADIVKALAVPAFGR